MNILVFDTETTGLVNFKEGPEHHSQPRLVQLGCLLTDETGKELASFSSIVHPSGYLIPDGMVHGINQKLALEAGLPLELVLDLFLALYKKSSLIVCHNFKFDSVVILSELLRNDKAYCHTFSDNFCTMLACTNICCIPNKWKSGFKWPKLEEAYQFFFGEQLSGAHDALVDVRATSRIFFELVKIGKGPGLEGLLVSQPSRKVGIDLGHPDGDVTVYPADVKEALDRIV